MKKARYPLVLDALLWSDASSLFLSKFQEVWHKVFLKLLLPLHGNIAYMDAGNV